MHVFMNMGHTKSTSSRELTTGLIAEFRPSPSPLGPLPRLGRTMVLYLTLETEHVPSDYIKLVSIGRLTMTSTTLETWKLGKRPAHLRNHIASRMHSIAQLHKCMYISV